MIANLAMFEGRVDPAAVGRFRAATTALTGAALARLGVAVSGGPDSLALLLLAAAAYPGAVEAATVDHRLRPESDREAADVGSVCERLGVRHTTLTLDWPSPPGGNLQARARASRYHLLGKWALERGLLFLATAHHADDQAETILLRLARGSGLSGLAGARRRALLVTDEDKQVFLLRPLLEWRRAELARIVEEAGLTAVDDPSNHDERFDRTHARALLRGGPAWLDPLRLTAAAGHLAEADDALAWSTRVLLAGRATIHDNGEISLDVNDLPPELQRRLLVDTLARFVGSQPIPGPKVVRALALLRAGRRCTLAGTFLTGGERWRIGWAPPRRDLPR
jgi:tRNA(Ile)-lysidine synthase